MQRLIVAWHCFVGLPLGLKEKYRDLWRIYASLGKWELIFMSYMCDTMPRRVKQICIVEWSLYQITTLIVKIMGRTWGPSGADRTQVGPMLAPWTVLSWYGTSKRSVCVLTATQANGYEIRSDEITPAYVHSIFNIKINSSLHDLIWINRCWNIIYVVYIILPENDANSNSVNSLLIVISLLISYKCLCWVSEIWDIPTSEIVTWKPLFPCKQHKR